MKCVGKENAYLLLSNFNTLNSIFPKVVGIMKKFNIAENKMW